MNKVPLHLLSEYSIKPVLGRVLINEPRSEDTILLDKGDDKYFIEALVDTGSPISLVKEKICLRNRCGSTFVDELEQ